MSFRIFQFSSPDSALFSFFLAAPEKFHHRVAASSCGTAAIPKLFTRHALPSPHREPGSFSEPTQTLSAGRPGPPPISPFSKEGGPSGPQCFSRPRLSPPGRRIAIDLFPARRHRLLGQQPVAALLRTLAKRILDDSVFERMKA